MRTKSMRRTARETLTKSLAGTRWSVGALLAALLATACTPTVKVEAPDKPIEINMNVNIKHEILVKVEKEVEAMFEDEDIF